MENSNKTGWWGGGRMLDNENCHNADTVAGNAATTF